MSISTGNVEYIMAQNVHTRQPSTPLLNLVVLFVTQ